MIEHHTPLIERNGAQFSIYFGISEVGFYIYIICIFSINNAFILQCTTLYLVLFMATSFWMP